MSKKEEHLKIQLCSNCTSAIFINEQEFLILCSNENSDHCGHILHYDHFSCDELVFREHIMQAFN